MKTRIELWREYRKEINNNIKLQEDAKKYDQNLVILNKRLLKVFPDYNKKFKFELETKNNNFFKEINKTSHISTTKINNIKIEINQVDSFSKISKIIDDIDFSSHELDYIIDKIRTRNNNLESGIWKLENNFKNQDDLLNKNNHQIIQIAIDGPSGSGKSTVAKLIAKKYGLNYVNTGLIYRAIAFNAMTNNVDVNDEDAVFASISDHIIKLKGNEKIFLKEIDVTNKLMTNEVSLNSSKISVHKKVRKWATIFLKYYSNKDKIIMDGRDVAFNIMPHANIKIFLETSLKKRAKRRFEENLKKGINTNFSKIFKEIKERDYYDKNRKINPLQITKDAHLINASKLSITEVVAKISAIIDKEFF